MTLPRRPQAVVFDMDGATFDIEAFWKAVDEDFHRIIEGRYYLKTGVIELLDWLDEANMPRAIATSSPHRNVQKNLAAHGLTGRFHAIVAHGDYDHGKPHPAPFLTAAMKLGVEPQDCLALEDSLNGVRSACGAGMMTVMIPDLITPTDDIRAICLAVARDLHEVRERLTASHVHS